MKKIFVLFLSVVCAILIFFTVSTQPDSLRSIKYKLMNASDTLLSGYDSLQANSGIGTFFPKASPRCSISYNSTLRYSTREKNWVPLLDNKLFFHAVYGVKITERVACDDDTFIVTADEKSIFQLTRSFFKGIGLFPYNGNFLVISKKDNINHIESDIGLLLISTNDLVRAGVHSQENEMRFVITAGSAAISFQPSWKKTSAKLYITNNSENVNILLKSGQKKLEKGETLILNSRGDHLEATPPPAS